MGAEDFWVVPSSNLELSELDMQFQRFESIGGFMSSLKTVIDEWGSSFSSDCCKWEGITCNSSSSFGIGLNDSVDTYRVVKLELPKRRLVGNLSASLGTLDQLRTLNLSHNFLKHSLPISRFHLPDLEFLDLSFNDFTGPILFGIDLPSIQLLEISQNLLNGSLPGSICDNNSIRLRVLNVAANYFSGNLSPGSGNLNRNKFTGEIPESFKNFHSLSDLGLSNSSLSNISYALQILQQCQNLTTLVLTFNFHGEQFLTDPTLHFEKMKVLIIANCRLRGVIPQWLSTSSRLQLLDISWNQLQGTIPDWFGNFSNLFYLDISNNSLSGEIPRSITGLRCLIAGRISTEEPSPDFPLFMWRNLQYKRVWSFRPTLDFSNNNLRGAIWPDFSKLRSLRVLDLKYNRLSGPIPSSLSEMVSLEILDLSHNELSGIIPPSLVKLSFLSKFCVADNELYGVIPTGGQFLTFSSAKKKDILWDTDWKILGKERVLRAAEFLNSPSFTYA